MSLGLTGKSALGTAAVVLALMTALFICPARAEAAKEEGGKFTFGVVFPPPLREEAHDYFIQLIDKVAEVVEKRAEIAIEMIKVDDEPHLYEAIKEGKLDSAFMYLPMAPLNAKKELPVELEMVLNIQRKKGARYCVYSLSDEFSCELAKQKKVFLSLYTYIPVREKLAGEGCDGPLWKIFGSLVKYDSTPAGFKAMVDGKIDLVATADFFETTILGAKEMKGVKSVWCSDYLPLWGLYIHKDVRPEIREKVRKILLSIHNDPLLEEWRTFFIAVNAKFVPPDKNLKKNLSELSERAAKNGWADELEQFAVKYYKTVPGETITFESGK
ncbi:MAG: hypothetical protein ABIH66_09490 [bacterium]